ncbi:caspase family protein [Parasphingorhabdus sp.]|uniref:caspase family protein n=1 Tax=Parasphingorhabdus sp. TaxID=2709688 RepID=UPI003262E0CA
MIFICVATIWPAMVEAKRVALIIGNSAYVNTSSLPNPTNDANIVADSAREAGFDDVVVALDLTISSFQRELRTFREKANGADVAMIYYAGHGMEGQGKNWLIPIDAELNTAFDLPYESINIERMMESVSGARIRMVVLDACRNNPFGNRWASGTRAVARGLAGFDADGVLVIYAAAPGQTASDGNGFNSPFALSLAKRLPQPDLPLQLLGGVVRDDVLSATGGNQRPFVSASITGTPVYLVKPAAPKPNPELATKTRSPAAPLSTTNRSTMDALMWRGANGAGTLAAYQAYIKEFPTGLFADLAKRNIEQLGASQGVASVPSVDSGTSSSTQNLVSKPRSSSTSQGTNSGVQSGPASVSSKNISAQPNMPDLPVPSTRTGSETQLAYVPPTTAEPDLPTLPATPLLPKEGYPDCRESYQIFEMPFDKAENINECTVKLDKYYSEILTPFRERMIQHQKTISQLYTDKVGGNMRYSPKSQDGFYEMMMREHADSDPDGANLADYRAAEARYQKDREYLQDRFCFNTGCGGYPVPKFDVEKALAQPKVKMERSTGNTDTTLALAKDEPEKKKRNRKKKPRSNSKKCKGARTGGGLFGGLVGGVIGDAAGLGKVGTLIASGVGAVVGAEIACQLDEKEQEKAAEATMAVVEKEEVGAVAKWQSPTRADVSGSSMITALTAEPDGRRCLNITDVAIIDGEETKIAKQMCRGPGEKNYTVMA